MQQDSVPGFWAKTRTTLGEFLVSLLGFPAKVFPWADAMVKFPTAMIAWFIEGWRKKKPVTKEWVEDFTAAIDGDPEIKKLPRFYILMVRDHGTFKVPVPTLPEILPLVGIKPDAVLSEVEGASAIKAMKAILKIAQTESPRHS
jgi:hypothetical protein